jgi:hypothetical protein
VSDLNPWLPILANHDLANNKPIGRFRQSGYKIEVELQTAMTIEEISNIFGNPVIQAKEAFSGEDIRLSKFEIAEFSYCPAASLPA